MKLSLFMYNQNPEEIKILSDLLADDFTIISFNNHNHATQFISSYHNWFDAAIISESIPPNENELSLMEILGQQNPDMSFGIINDENLLTNSFFKNNNLSVTYLTKPFDLKVVSLFASLAKYNSSKTDVMNLWS